MKEVFHPPHCAQTTDPKARVKDGIVVPPSQRHHGAPTPRVQTI